MFLRSFFIVSMISPDTYRTPTIFDDRGSVMPVKYFIWRKGK